MNTELEASTVKTMFIHVQFYTGETTQNGFNKLITFHLYTVLLMISLLKRLRLRTHLQGVVESFLFLMTNMKKIRKFEQSIRRH